jgi:hypothetical protein
VAVSAETDPGTRRSALDDIFFIFPRPFVIWARGCLTDIVRLPHCRVKSEAQKGTGAMSGMNSRINQAGPFLVAALLSALSYRAAIAAPLFALL